KLTKSVAYRAPDEAAVGDGGLVAFADHDGASLRQVLDQKVLPAAISTCSTTGPSASAGKNSSPAMMRITPTTTTTNSAVSVGNVPAEAGTLVLRAREPAIAITGTT